MPGKVGKQVDDRRAWPWLVLPDSKSEATSPGSLAGFCDGKMSAKWFECHILHICEFEIVAGNMTMQRVKQAKAIPCLCDWPIRCPIKKQYSFDSKLQIKQKTRKEKAINYIFRLSARYVFKEVVK